MKSAKSLRALSARCGIALDYADRTGNRHPVSDWTLEALLSAMQVPGDQRTSATRKRGDPEPRSGLPVARVVRAHEPTALSVPTAAVEGRRAHRWTVHLEDGEVLTGKACSAKAPACDEVPMRNGRHHLTLEFPPLAPGYHRLAQERPDGTEIVSIALIATPEKCYRPDALRDDGRVWGPAIQLYGLRSRRNWGIGDFTDLRNLLDLTANAGGGIVTTNPLHALYAPGPVHANPHVASHRAFLNALYIDVEAVPEFRECKTAQELVASERFQARLRSLRAEERIGYRAVAEIKHEVLALLHRRFREQQRHQASERGQAFRRFRLSGGPALEDYARFEVLQTQANEGSKQASGRQTWPAAFRDAASTAVASFAAEHAEAVEFQVWLQWLADQQLGAAGHHSWQRGLGIGLCVGLAMGAHCAGAETWHRPWLYADGAHVGLPPDPGEFEDPTPAVTPMIPHRLRQAGYLPFIHLLQANMRHAGAVRIDRISALARQFWIPDGEDAAAGAYVDYPFDDLLGILALESQRNQCLVIGDGAHAPSAVQTRLDETGVLASCPFLLTRDTAGGFRPPPEYPRDALVSITEPAQPTLRGFWLGSDVDTREALGLFRSAADLEARVIARAQDRARFLLALAREGLLPEGSAVHPVALPDLSAPFVTAVHAYLARTPSRILVVRPEDILGVAEPTYLPGSDDQHYPNWRRRLPLDLEDWRADERFSRLGELLRRELGSSVTPQPAATAATVAAIIPRATYRLQFNQDFTFAQAAELVPYLAGLGISHCYASPYLTARPGSKHGYDIVDHGSLNLEIGSEEDYERFLDTLRHHGLAQILDIVPNHMGVMGADNAWWLDVLENGPASAYARFFDIDWASPNRGLHGKILLPILGDHYGTVLNSGALRLDCDPERGELSLFYYQHRLPLDPATYPRVIGHRRERLAAVMGEEHAQFVELESLLSAFGHLPSRLESDPALQVERQRDKEVHKRHLAALCRSNADIAHHIEENLVEFNGRPGDPVSFDPMHELIQAQGYRPAYWRVASDEINYRRFFDINELAALRIEEPEVFAATHRLVLDLIAQGKVKGLRIDHPDGLYDPGGYFARLHEAILGRPLAPGDPLPIYLVIEKILAEHERLLESWPVHGATGYRFANLTNALFVDSAAERRMTRIYASFTGCTESFDTLVYRSKKLIMDTALASELNVLANRLARLAAASRDTCDFTLSGLRETLAEVAASFPVYRSYVSSSGLTPDDRRYIEWAVRAAKRRNPAGDPSIFDFLQSVLTTDIAQGRTDAYRLEVLSFAMKFQQFTAPVVAKGVEDTAFYRYHRLVSLNDVGGDPRAFGVSVARYHAAARTRTRQWPHNLLASSTHDSKRSEDVRARLNVLTEMPAAWKLMVRRWSGLNRKHKREIDGAPAPSSNDEYLLYQTLVGTWPTTDLAAARPGLDDYRERIRAYMLKAVREAKEVTSWINVNDPYEAALVGFVDALLAPGDDNPFLADFVPAIRPIVRAGLVNSLAQTLLKLTSPGVPDVYQGCELWQFHLVDPDNRRAIDFARRQEILAELTAIADAPDEHRHAWLDALVANTDDGRIKLYLIRQALALRARWPEVFRDGDYRPLAVHGRCANHVCAFVRRDGDRNVVVAVPRLALPFLPPGDGLAFGSEAWLDTELVLPTALLAGSVWRNLFTGTSIDAASRLSVGQLLGTFPVALLESSG